MPNIRIPDIVKHCTVAIYRKGRVVGANKRDTFIQCFKIAREMLQKQGYVQLTSLANLASAIALTSMGRAREMKHKREGRAKSILFDTLYDQFDIDGTKAAKARKAQEAAAQLVANRQDQAKAEKTAAKKPAKRKPKPKKPPAKDRF